MKANKRGLGSEDAMTEYDGVDAFGLDEFGMPAGLSPLWGGVAAAGLGSGASIAIRHFASPVGFMARHSEAIGFLAGAAAGGAMMLSRRTRAAGWTALAVAFLGNGLRAVEQELMKSPGAAGVVIEPTQALQGYGLGLVDINQTQALLGDDRTVMPQLVGASLQAASDHVQLVGGPALSSVSGHWGATHFNHH